MKIAPLTVAQLVQATGGELLAGDAAAVITGAAIDSRQVEPGDVFIAVPGNRVDGHLFAGDAVGRGAAALLVNHMPPGLDGAPGGAAVVRVVDTVAALGEWGRAHRRAHAVPVVAVTGSVGKTSTKEMVAAVLSARWRTLKTEGNLNTEFGVPLSLLGLAASHGAAVVEMGMRGPGEITELCRIAEPRVGIVTNVGPVHLELLGSIENIARAKAELPAALPPDGWAVLNGDDPLVRAMAQQTPARTVFYGWDKSCAFSARDLHAEGETTRFVLVTPEGEVEVRLPIPGQHQVGNALAAAASGSVLGLSLDEVAAGLNAFQPAGSRTRRISAGGLQIIDDTYNASPASMFAALEVLDTLASGRRAAVLGNMFELGAWTVSGHRRVGAEAAQREVDLLVTVGDLAEDIAYGATEAGLPPQRVQRVPDNAAALDVLRGWLRPGDTVLVKGSRGMKMEEVVQGLRAWAEGGAAGV